MPRIRPLVAVSSTLVREPGKTMRVRVNAAYTRALEAAGLTPLVVPPLVDLANAAAVIAAVDGLVLTGGEDIDPARYGAPPHRALGAVVAERDATELALVAAARLSATPVLAICRGIQLLNVALGGTLVQDLPSERPSEVSHAPEDARSRRTHVVSVAEGSRLAQAMGAAHITVNSSHHQAVDRVATGLRATGTAPDGVVEGVETADDAWWVLGVQWHPEELTDTPEAWDRDLFAAFAAIARSRR
jgi:putative glutamine amidotransferase